jgi:hypothetical protein
MHNISFFSRFVFDGFIAKGGEYEHKIGRTLANRVDERRNMINDYLRGRACIESVRGIDFRGVLILSFSFSSELFLPLLCHFAWLCRFLCHLLAFTIFLLLDDLLELFLVFLVFYLCFMGSWIRTSNFMLLLSMDSSRGRLRNQVTSSLV